MKASLTMALALLWLTVTAQPEAKSVVIGSMTTRPNALLIVNPPNANQGVLLPQLSTGQRKSMKPSSPHEDGLIVFDKNANAYHYWGNGTWWKMIAEKAERTNYYSLDPANFHELKAGNDLRHNNIVVFASDNAFVTASRNGLGEQGIAAVNLPHGARLSEVTVYYMDDDDDNMKVQFVRKNLAGGSEEIVSWESSGASSAVNSVRLTDFSGKETIDLENFTYRMIVSFDIDEEVYTPAAARQRLYGIKFSYTE